MKTLKVGICFLNEEDVVVSKRVVGTNWEVNVEQDLKRKPNIHFLDEISEILTENLKLQLESGLVKDMLSEIQIQEKVE